MGRPKYYKTIFKWKFGDGFKMLYCHILQLTVLGWWMDLGGRFQETSQKDILGKKDKAK